MIPTTYLNELAQYTNGKIAKVVLNGTYTITNFALKRVSASVVELSYKVPLGSVATVTSIALKDTSDKVISSNPVHVPITTDTSIRQTIDFREV